VLLDGEQRLEGEQVDPGVVGVELLGQALEPLPLDAEPGLLQPVEHGDQRAAGTVVGDGGAEATSLVGGQPVRSTGDHQPLGRQLQVQPALHVVADRRGSRGLVRRLVLGEADVAVRAEELGLAELGPRSSSRACSGVFTAVSYTDLWSVQ
jgi:hypothetical protein